MKNAPQRVQVASKQASGALAAARRDLRRSYSRITALGINRLGKPIRRSLDAAQRLLTAEWLVNPGKIARHDELSTCMDTGAPFLSSDGLQSLKKLSASESDPGLTSHSAVKSRAAASGLGY